MQPDNAIAIPIAMRVFSRGFTAKYLQPFLVDEISDLKAMKQRQQFGYIKAWYEDFLI